MHWMEWYGCGTGFCGLLVLLFWVLVIMGLVYLVKALSGSKGKAGDETALEILRKRYARGEISREEFEEKKKDLLN